VVEVYNSPFPELPYDKTTIENPLYKFFNFPTEVQLGEYQNTPIDWLVLYYTSSVVLLSKNILVKGKYDDSSATWKTSYIRGYLNGPFFTSSFTEEEKTIIQSVETDSGVFDKVFLLSKEGNYRYQLYYKINTNTERVATYHGSVSTWWLRTPDDEASGLSDYVNTDGEVINRGLRVNSNLGIRPVIVLSLDSFRSTINPFYGQTIWGRLTNPTPEDKDKFMLSVSDPFSAHNQKPQSVDKDLYKRIKSDFAIFTPPVSGNIYSFNYVFKNETITKEIITLDDVPDGIYLTAKCIFIKENGTLYQTGYADINSSMEQLFLSKFEKTTTCPGKSVYASCWADLDPRIELYLPVYEDLGNGSSNKFYRWLGERFDKTEDNDTLFNGIVIYRNEQFI
jgi:hypothetical protein